MNIRAGYAASDDGDFYVGVLRAMHPLARGMEPGEVVWTCEHEHPAPRKSPITGGGPTLTSALDCARAELARRAGEAVQPTTEGRP